MTTVSEDMANWAEKLGKPVESERPKTKTNAAAFTRVANAPKPKATGNEQKASQAVQVLVQWNNGLSMLAMMGMLFETASAISDREEVFREQAFAALVADEKLCDTIIKMGTKSAMFGLMFVYASLAVGVVPVAREEMKTRTFNPRQFLDMFKRDAEE
jgi:hypothetical protein